MKTVAVRHIERTEMPLVDGFACSGVAAAHEAQGRSGLLEPHIRPIYPGACIAGNAVTVLTQPGDNWMLHVAMELCQPGDLLVVACTEPCNHGFFGDLLATSAKAQGVRGLVIDAGVRDTRNLQKMNFPVWSKAIHAQGTVKETLGAVNVPIVCAGQQVCPGDTVVADDDGVCVVERLNAAEVLGRVKQRQSLEETNRARFEAGEFGLDVYHMRSKLEEKGLVYLDDLDAYEKYKNAQFND